MLEVHHLNNSRSQRVLWLLEELGTPYTIVHYQRDLKTKLAPESLKGIHPLGKSPVIRDGEQVIAESGAIVDYLIEHYGAGKLVPKRGTAEFESYRYWLHYAEGSLMMQLLVKLYVGRTGDGGKPVLERVNSQIQMHVDFVEQQLQGKLFLAGGELTGADIQMSFPVEVVAAQGTLTDQHPNLRNWLARIHARPAYQRGLEKGGPYDYAK